jgi:hypothetical protein
LLVARIRKPVSIGDEPLFELGVETILEARGSAPLKQVAQALPLRPVCLVKLENGAIVNFREVRPNDTRIQFIEVSLANLLACAVLELVGDQAVGNALFLRQMHVTDDLQNFCVFLLRPGLAGMANARSCRHFR